VLKESSIESTESYVMDARHTHGQVAAPLVLTHEDAHQMPLGHTNLVPISDKSRSNLVQSRANLGPVSSQSWARSLRHVPTPCPSRANLMPISRQMARTHVNFVPISSHQASSTREN